MCRAVQHSHQSPDPVKPHRSSDLQQPYLAISCSCILETCISITRGRQRMHTANSHLLELPVRQAARGANNTRIAAQVGCGCSKCPPVSRVSLHQGVIMFCILVVPVQVAGKQQSGKQVSLRTSNGLEATGGPIGGGEREARQARYLICCALQPCHRLIGLQPCSYCTAARR